ncbi:MAG: hypothetical protein GY854_29690 [Deltaproteobacteria bacterium]|nr:hypothetical protein [Deltaproteobacteria bacterium]
MSYAIRLLIILLVPAISPTAAFSQDTPQPSDMETQLKKENDTLKLRLDALENRIDTADKQGAQPDGEKEALKKRVEMLEKRLDDAEEERMAELENDSDSIGPTLDIYGFFDLELIKMIPDDDNPTGGLSLAENLTFTMSNINIYFSSQLTETLRSLLELRFTFNPLGQELTYYPEYNRIDTSATETGTGQQFKLGGVIIERAKLTWQPFDFFGVTAGRYLTPFGIWNVDHGSPVLIPFTPPYIITTEAMPVAQTGLQVHGRFLPTSSFFIDYAVTLANGRGPTESAYDLDDNKALGLRLRFVYKGRNVHAALGGYGYYGHTTDSRKELDLDHLTDSVLEIHTVNTEKYKELTGSLDFLLELYGVRLQAEYVRGIIQYETRPFRVFVPVTTEPMGTYMPDHIKSHVYGLLAWELPLHKYLGEMTLTPYIFVEYSVPEDSLAVANPLYVRFGLNYKPNAFVVLKVEAGRNTVESESLDPDPQSWMVAGQMAVSF